MENNSAHIQSQYLGYLNTPLLWKENAVLDLQQLQLPEHKTSVFNSVIIKNLRLGKRVERFVTHQLQQYDAISVLAENIQIQKDKLTLGELDCLLMYKHSPIHLEVVYKFYLYDASNGASEIEHWIGPNRNDSLIQKLTKLKEKQLPLLYRPETKPVLDKLNISASQIQQYVLFKAQLFVPLIMDNIIFEQLNSDCVIGFYVSANDLEQFSNCKFYMPPKIDWLIEIKTQTDWLGYHAFLTQLKPLIDHKTSPLCWIKRPNGELQKCFVVWWE